MDKLKQKTNIVRVGDVPVKTGTPKALINRYKGLFIANKIKTAAKAKKNFASLFLALTRAKTEKNSGKSPIFGVLSP